MKRGRGKDEEEEGKAEELEADTDNELEFELERELERQLDEEEEEGACNENENESQAKKKRKIGNATGALNLIDIPDHTILLIMTYLSARDLYSCSQTCKSLNKVSTEDLLWKRLYNFRWPNNHGKGWKNFDGTKGTEDAENKSWREIYFERAKADSAFALTGCDDFLREHLKQMQAHLLESCPERGAIDKLNKSEKERKRCRRSRTKFEGSIKEQIKNFREKHGLQPSQWSDANPHVCDGRVCEMVALGGDHSMVFVCKSTGKVHVCGEACAHDGGSLVVDSESGTKVCKITGYVVESDMTTLHGGDWENEGEKGMHHDLGDSFGKGRLGRAYEAGYFANEAPWA